MIVTSFQSLLRWSNGREMTLCWTSVISLHNLLRSGSMQTKVCWSGKTAIFGRRPLAKCRRSILHLISKAMQDICFFNEMDGYHMDGEEMKERFALKRSWNGIGLPLTLKCPLSGPSIAIKVMASILSLSTICRCSHVIGLDWPSNRSKPVRIKVLSFSLI